MARVALTALIGLCVLAGIAVAARHLYILNAPAGSVAECGASLDYMMDVLPLHEVLAKVLGGSGECAKVTWRFLGLSMPFWVLVNLVGLAVLGLLANLRKRCSASEGPVTSPACGRGRAKRGGGSWRPVRPVLSRLERQTRARQDKPDWTSGPPRLSVFSARRKRAHGARHVTPAPPHPSGYLRRAGRRAWTAARSCLRSFSPHDPFRRRGTQRLISSPCPERVSAFPSAGQGLLIDRLQPSACLPFQAQGNGARSAARARTRATHARSRKRARGRSREQQFHNTFVNDTEPVDVIDAHALVHLVDRRIDHA